MHEFSIVLSIIDIAIDSARKNHADTVSAVEIEVGQASGVVSEALEFAWESAKKGTLLDQANLVIKNIPLVLLCRECRYQYQADEQFGTCPQCGEDNPEILSGRELKVIAIIT